MSVTIRRVLELPVVRRGVPEVVAGANLIDRPLRWVHAAEVQNIASLLKGGELLLTTGMGLGSDAVRQRRIACELADRGVGGLVLELGSTFAAVPPALVAACRDAELPLVALHRPVPFVEVTEAIHAEIINSQFAIMQRGEDLHLRFTDLLLQGAGVTEMLDALAETTGNPVLLRRPGGDVIAVAPHGLPQADVLAAWDTAARGLPGAPAFFERPVPSGEAGRPSAALVVLGLKAAPDDFSAVALERAVALVGLALQHDRGEHAISHRERGAFLADVLRGDLLEADAAARAATFGFRAETLLPIAIGRRAPRIGGLTKAEDADWVQVWGDVRRALEAQHTPAVLGHLGEGTLLVVGLRSPQERVEAAERAVQTVRTAAERRLGSADAAVVCLGIAAASWRALAGAAEQALTTLPAAAAVSGRRWHDMVVPDVELLFVGLRDASVLRDFTVATLAPVIAHDARKSAKLLPTLEVYCAHGGRKAAAARELQLERRSLYHRIARLEALLSASLSDPDTLLGVSIALRMRRYVEHDSLRTPDDAGLSALG